MMSERLADEMYATREQRAFEEGKRYQKIKMKAGGAHIKRANLNPRTYLILREGANRAGPELLLANDYWRFICYLGMKYGSIDAMQLALMANFKVSDGYSGISPIPDTLLDKSGDYETILGDEEDSGEGDTL